MIDERFSYYECGICGQKSQVLVDVIDPETEQPVVDQETGEVVKDFDGYASYLEAVKHEEEVHKIEE